MNFLSSQYNIIQAPMAGGVLTPDLVASVINSGMIGSIASAYLSLEKCGQFIQEVVQKSSNNFILNIFIENVRREDQVFKKPSKVIEIEKQLGIYQSDEFVVPKSMLFTDYLQLINKYKIPAVSSTFGLFSDEVIKNLHESGVKVIASVTSKDEALAAIKSNVDALIIQGTEAGGHQAGFLSQKANTLETKALLQEIKALNVPQPLIITGGISVDDLSWYLAHGANYTKFIK